MCGATGQQKQISDEQNAFYQEMTSEYKTVFGEDQSILKNLTDTFSPILAKGPNQEGFSPEEKAPLQTQINETSADNFRQSSDALDSELSAEGGGNQFLPSGGNNQLKEELVSANADQRSRDELNATEADFSAGKSLFDEAARALGSTAGLLNPIGMAGATTGAGSAASETANEIAQADNSVFGSIMGGIGGIAGNALGEGGIITKHV